MQINKFKLLDAGFSGIEVDAVVANLKGKISVLDQEKRTRKISCSAVLRTEVAKLRYALLAICKYWDPSFNDMFDFTEMSPQEYKANAKIPDGFVRFRDLWNSCNVSGVTTKGNQFLISGTLVVIGDKKIVLNTPLIAEDDDFHFFSETAEIIREIHHQIVEYFENDQLSLSQAREFLLEKFKNDDDEKSRIESQSEEDSMEEMMHYLESKGAVVLMPPAAISDGKEEKKSETKVKGVKGAVNADRYIEPVKDEPKGDFLDQPVTDQEYVREEVRTAPKVSTKKKEEKKEEKKDETDW